MENTPIIAALVLVFGIMSFVGIALICYLLVKVKPGQEGREEKVGHPEEPPTKQHNQMQGRFVPHTDEIEYKKEKNRQRDL